MDTNDTNQVPQKLITDVLDQKQPQIKINKSNKLILSVIGLVVLLLLSIGIYILISKNSLSPSVVVSPTSSVSKEIENDILVYENNGVILLHGLQSKPLVVDPNGSSPSYASMQQKIAYVNPGIDGDNAVYIYDIQTEKTEKLKETVGEGTLHNVMWSPGENILLLWQVPASLVQ